MLGFMGACGLQFCAKLKPSVFDASCYIRNMKLLVFDTETTGLPRRSTGPPHTWPTTAWPHPVQISAVLYDCDKGDIAESYDSVVGLPDNVIVPAGSSAVHGITTDECRESGVPVSDALQQLFEMARKAHVIVGHNLEFDLGVVTAAAARWSCSAFQPGCLHIDASRSLKPRVCTMREGTPLCKLPFPRPRDVESKEFKYPKLGELAAHLFGSAPPGLHDSFVDVLVCLRCHMRMWSGIDTFRTCGPSLRSTHTELGLTAPETNPSNSRMAD